jgi:D-serine deaminase-like pyridoxal phosphate-dependent protein
MPLTRADLPTPALLLDLDDFEANVARMQLEATGSGKQLRPHAKAHKCVPIARRQVEAGAVGVAVATVAELELMTGAGIGVLLTSPVASRSGTDRVARARAAGGDIAVVLDHSVQVRLYAESAERAGVRVDVLVDLDIGDHRTGVPCDERAIALAREVARERWLRFCGLQAYSVSGSHTEDKARRRAHSTEALGQAIGIRRALLDEGFDAGLLTGGSTGTWDIDTRIEGFSELQAGSYPLMDLEYRDIVGDDFRNALTVLATVISASHPDRVTLDAGFKAFSTDRPFGPEPVGLDGVRWAWAGDEHGFLHLDRPSRTLAVGDRLEFIPPHCDPTVNLYDRIHALRGERVEHIWPVKRPESAKPFLESLET